MIEIKVEDKAVMELLKKLYKRTGDLTPAMEEIGEIILASVEENFERGGRPKWPDLADSTKRQRARKGYWPGKILQRTGQLAASISKDVTPTSVAVGTNKKYAAIHQFGGKAGRGRKVTIPARPYLMVQDEDMREIKDAIIEHLTKGVN